MKKEFPWWLDALIYALLLVLLVKIGAFKGRAGGSTRGAGGKNIQDSVIIKTR